MTLSTSFPTRNALLAVADYLAQPVLLLAVTPVLLRHLGSASFSVYLLVNSVVAASTLLSSGFGDALIRHRLELEKLGRVDSVDFLARTVITLNALLGFAVGIGVAVAAPWIAGFIRGFSPAELAMSTAGLRVGALLLVLRSTEMAVLACLRSFERYDIAAPVSIAGKIAGLVLATAAAAAGCSVVRVIAATVLGSAVALLAELALLRREGIVTRLRPMLHRETLRHIGGFGTLSWVQSIVGVATQQADKLIVGALLGASSFSTYSLCAQLSMPVHSITGAGLQALFPRLNRLSAAEDTENFRSTLRSALAINVVCVLACSTSLMVFAEPVLRHWVGREIAQAGAVPLRWMTLGTAFLALNVTGYWALMALGRIRLLVGLNVLGAVVMIAGVVLLTPRWGLSGAAAARMFFGPITWLSYRALFTANSAASAVDSAAMEAA